jgi:hypothetical protein
MMVFVESGVFPDIQTPPGFALDGAVLRVTPANAPPGGPDRFELALSPAALVSVIHGLATLVRVDGNGIPLRQWPILVREAP